MRSLAFIILSPVQITLLSNLLRLAYSFRHAPPIQQTMMLAILISVGMSPSPLMLNPNSFKSFSLKSFTFSTYLVTTNLSPLLKLLSNPMVNFFSIFPLPSIILFGSDYLVNLFFNSLYRALCLISGTFSSNCSIYFVVICSQYIRIIIMSRILSVLFPAVYSKMFISFLSYELNTRLRQISSSYSLYSFNFRERAYFINSSTVCICMFIFLLLSFNSFSSSSLSFYPINLTFSLVSYS